MCPVSNRYTSFITDVLDQAIFLSARLLLTSIKNSFPVLCNITAGNWALEGCPKMTEKAVGRYFLNGTQNRDHFFAPLFRFNYSN